MFSGCRSSAFPSWFFTTVLIIVVEIMTLGLPQVCKLWLGVSKGMLPVKHLAPQILMTVNYCGCQQAQRLAWVEPACHIQEGAIPHPGACKHNLKCDGRQDWHLGVRVGTWNLGSLGGKEGDVRKTMIDVCCLQEVRWRRQGERMLEMRVKNINGGCLKKEMALVV